MVEADIPFAFMGNNREIGDSEVVRLQGILSEVHCG